MPPSFFPSKFFTFVANFRESRTVIWPYKFAEKFAISSPSVFSRQSRHPSVSREARRPIGRFCSRVPRRCTPRNKRRRPCHHNSSRKAASATAVARAHARRPVVFFGKCAISSPSPNSPSKTRDCTGKSNGRLRVQKLLKNLPSFLPTGLSVKITSKTMISS